MDTKTDSASESDSEAENKQSALARKKLSLRFFPRRGRLGRLFIQRVRYSRKYN